MRPLLEAGPREIVNGGMAYDVLIWKHDPCALQSPRLGILEIEPVRYVISFIHLDKAEAT